MFIPTFYHPSFQFYSDIQIKIEKLRLKFQQIGIEITEYDAIEIIKANQNGDIHLLETGCNLYVSGF